MERKKFLKSIGAGAAFALVFPCVHGCSSGGEDIQDTPVPTGVDFTIDLNSSEASNLKNNGGFILKNLVVVVRNLQGDFVAASQVCSHQGTEAVRFIDDNNGIFYCSTHGSRFDQTGAPLNSITNKPLKIFKTELNGDILRVFE
ncbi:MAG: Rieske Fe-S protein [Sediminicola sp.]|jgi:Rieske Fe-S protein